MVLDDCVSPKGDFNSASDSKSNGGANRAYKTTIAMSGNATIAIDQLMRKIAAQTKIMITVITIVRGWAFIPFIIQDTGNVIKDSRLEIKKICARKGG